jgi:conjugal transfer pilus assembly protein TraE
MHFSHYRSELQGMIKKRNGYAVIAVGALFLCLLLTVLIFCLIGREKVVLVPPVIEKSFWVSSAHVSPEYLSEMTAFFAYLRLNVTADSASLQHNTLLQYTDPGFYNALKGQLLQESDHLIEQHLSTAFFPVSVKVDSGHLTAVITGDLYGYVGETALPTQRVAYAVTYRFAAGRLWVRAFKEVKTHD